MKGDKLRRLLDRGKIIVAPGAYDALSARIIEKAGFDAVYMTGAGTSISLLGSPDVGLITMSEMVMNAQQIASVSIPVIADANAGFGNAINVMRTVSSFIRAGVAAIHIEDQVTPKRCGHIRGKEIIPLEEAIGKYKAADEVRKMEDPNLILIARTDARGAVGGSLREAVKRGNAYAEAGADVIFPEAPVSVKELKYLVDNINAPILYHPSGLSPRLSIEKLEEIGVAIILYPGASIIPAAKAIWDHVHELKDKGTQAQVELEEEMKSHPLGIPSLIRALFELVGYNEILDAEEKYLSKKVLGRRKKSVGY